MSEPATRTAAAASDAATLDPAEVERFSRLAGEWWSPTGKFRPLHQIGPARLEFVRDAVCRHHARDARAVRPLTGLTVLDIGCGGGLMCEPLARLGASVTGIDPAADGIAAARLHAAGSGLAIEYRAGRAEDLVSEGRTFDAVLCLEVVEHVPDPAAFIALAARLVRRGGLMVLSTLNRTLKSYALAIVGAEYLLRWLPVGTHQWERFLTPEELRAHTVAAGLEPQAPQGLVYSPLTGRWSLGPDTDVNYLMAAARPAAEAAGSAKP